MRILIIDIDSTIPNIALHKVAKYYSDKGDEVIWNNPLFAHTADKIYVSCVFSYNKHLCDEWIGRSGVEIGGSGFNLTQTLPPEIEVINPKINLGFTTRGCIRNCHFCIVPKKEGKIHIVGDVIDLWDGKSKTITILDNNILALPEHFFKISKQLKDNNLRVDFNGGIDFRLITDDIVKELFSLKHIHEIRFAFDDYVYKPKVLNALEILKRNGLKDWQTRWYIYTGVKDTLETVLERCNIIHKEKQLCYIMMDRDERVQKNRQFQALNKWCNWAPFFKYEFYQVLEKSKHFDYFRKDFGLKEKPVKEYTKSLLA
jgi:hypothetical protein